MAAKSGEFLHHASGELFVSRGPVRGSSAIVYRKAVGASGRDWVLRRSASGTWTDEVGHEYKLLGGRSHATKKKIAYRIKLTPSELSAVEFARGRYVWPDMLAAHAAEDGSIAFTESEMWQWTDDVDSDTTGGHSPFPLASGAFAEKLQRFYDERI
jgi:hypothetical protein